eukprot:TRINITY_DN39872_c0_g1_i1.p1 TRINITY_DN39872_c0_g1~~TRINITY_DN39872_c0_g1_i1.p1  ORF type:complete len:103 (+),score=10.74 TRINITY_DN39872_c0_g1_i1:11-319(+)
MSSYTLRRQASPEIVSATWKSFPPKKEHISNQNWKIYPKQFQKMQKHAYGSRIGRNQQLIILDIGESSSNGSSGAQASGASRKATRPQRAPEKSKNRKRAES